MKLIKYSLVVFLLGLFALSSAQIIGGISQSDEEIFKFRVKQLSEFINLFNNDVDYESRGITEEERAGISREMVLMSLFDLSDPRFDSKSESYSEEYKNTAREFISQVLEKEPTLSKSSEEIYAIANANGTFKNKAVTFDIILNQEVVGKDMLKWVISDVDAEFISVLKEDTINLRFLPPSSDELDFMELTRALNDLDYLDQYADRDYTYDPLSVFIYLVNKGDIKIETVLSVNYKILDITGWCIELSDFNRNTKNSGWLICDLKRASDQDQ